MNLISDYQKKIKETLIEEDGLLSNIQGTSDLDIGAITSVFVWRL